MLFFYIRHGDPIYDPDSLTVLGEKQAGAIAKRLSLYGVDKIYSSSSNRAIQTAKPTCDLLKKDMEVLEFANESLAHADFSIEKDGRRMWLFLDEETKLIFTDKSIVSRGLRWYEDDRFSTYKKGIDRIAGETSKFFEELGYEHIRETGRYKVVKPNNNRVAFFAHEGFGLAFLSELLDIPYPVIVNHFGICHTGMTVIEFKEVNGFAIPKVLMMSADSHLYKEGLPTKYNNKLYF